MEPNARRLQKTLDRIMSEIESWGQGLWGQVPQDAVRSWAEKETFIKAPTCGASYCLAGHAAILAGTTPLLERSTNQITHVALKGKLRAALRGEHGATGYIPEVAGGWLGLTERQADRLFEASNSLAHLYAYAFVWTGGKITIPDRHDEFHDGEGEWTPEEENLPQEVRDVLRTVELHHWPEEVEEPLLKNRSVLLGKLDKQIERARQAQQERDNVHAAHGS